MAVYAGFTVEFGGIGFNTTDLNLRGAPSYAIFWGDGMSDVFTPNSANNDGLAHTYATDGLYIIKVNDRPNLPETPQVRLAMYAYSNATENLDISSGALQDMVTGGSGADRIATRSGNDFVGSGDGDDTVDGGEGDDVLLGGRGDDLLTGGAGSDLLGGGGDDAGADRLYGGAGADFIYGDAGSDRLFGGTEDDYLDGGSDGDVLNGEAGDDVLLGAGGRDNLYGGAGLDTFEFRDVSDSGVVNATRDVIFDFVQGEDRIRLSGIDADVSTAYDPDTGDGLDAFTFIGATGFSGTAGELRYGFRGSTTIVEADVNGDGAADFQVQILSAVNLTQNDFYI